MSDFEAELEPEHPTEINVQYNRIHFNIKEEGIDDHFYDVSTKKSATIQELRSAIADTLSYPAETISLYCDGQALADLLAGVETLDRSKTIEVHRTKKSD